MFEVRQLARMVGREKGEELLGWQINDFIPYSAPESHTALKKLIQSGYSLTNWETVESNENKGTFIVMPLFWKLFGDMPLF